jgi:hypothetical protein
MADAGVIRMPIREKRSKTSGIIGGIAVVLFAGVLIVLALHYLMPGQALVDETGKHMDPIPGAMPYFDIAGSVAHPGTFDVREYQSKYITINAVNRRDGNHAYDFTGVPLNLVLADADIADNATKLDFIAADKYVQTFEVSAIMADSTYILVQENNEVDLVAKNTTSHYWVRGIVTINVY